MFFDLPISVVTFWHDLCLVYPFRNCQDRWLMMALSLEHFSLVVPSQSGGTIKWTDSYQTAASSACCFWAMKSNVFFLFTPGITILSTSSIAVKRFAAAECNLQIWMLCLWISSSVCRNFHPPRILWFWWVGITGCFLIATVMSPQLSCLLAFGRSLSRV